MPLFLKNIAPELDIFGNRQLFNFNKDQANGENESALTLINHFTPITNVNANSTFEFLTPTLKGFRFNHSLSTIGTFGNFSFDKYNRFGSSISLWGYDELTDSLLLNKESSFISNAANNQINLVSTSLDTVGNLKINIAKKIPNTQTYKGYQLSYEYSDSIGDSFSLFRDNNSVLDRLFAHSETLNTFIFYRSVSLNTNRVVNLGNGLLLSDATNLGQLNSAITGLGFSSLSANGLLARTAANTYVSRNITVGSNLTISNSDGVSGNPLINLASNITTNSFTTTGGDVNATTGTLKGNNIAVHNSSSIGVLNSLNMNSTNYINFLPTPINNQDATTKQYVDSKSPTAQSILHGYMYNTQTTNLATGDHIKFDNTAFIRTSSISLDISSSYTTTANAASIGRITLVAGKTYKLTGITCTAAFTSTSSAYIGLKWYNSDSNTPLGTVNTWWSSSWSYTSGGAVVAFITTNVTTRVELRITSISSISQIYGTSDSNSATWFVVEEI